MATSFITLLPIISLILFGGDTLKDFALALFIGIVSGAFSTVFIATPFLAVLMEREPEYARRKDAGLQEKLETVGEKSDGRRADQPEPEAAEAEAAPVEAAVAVAEENGEPDEDESEKAAVASKESAAARREARRKRRRARPHGRAR